MEHLKTNNPDRVASFKASVQPAVKKVCVV